MSEKNQALLDAIVALGPTPPLAQLDALSKRMRAELTDDDGDDGAADPARVAGPSADEVWARWNQARRGAEAALLLAEPDPVAAAVAAGRPDVVARVGTDAALAAALEQAAAHVALPYYKTNSGWLSAVAALATTPARRSQALAFLGPALRGLVEARLAGGELINSVALGGLARALAVLAAPETADVLAQTLDFCIGKKCHYEAKQQAGTVAIALAATGRADGDAAMQAFLERWADTYAGHRFVMEVRYAAWLRAGDGAGARAFLADPANTRGLAFVAAAVADLDDKASAAVLQARRPTLRNPVAEEAFDEALTRLRDQAGPPPQEARMIWMFGVRSPTEVALGHESDDQLLARARARLGRPGLGRVYETDDTGPAEQ
ncbi:MAG: hypothetical protein KBG28_15095 [Kofleriaceae bacterium]|nr:hypothetical protein [Kofleriaceae bacterium]